MTERPDGLVPDEDRGPAIVTQSGRSFHVLDPRPEDIDIEDIAHALANLCRFTGHCDSFYSVAQHSILVSEIMQSRAWAEDEQAWGLWGLLHDATEAYIGDVSRPLKYALRMTSASYDVIEYELMHAIATRFSLRGGALIAEHLKAADNIALATERRDLMTRCKTEWRDLPEPLPKRISPKVPVEARFMFNNQFAALVMR